MTLEEAIEHCKEVATENRRCALEFARVNVYDAARNCQKCAAEHEQVAEWLAELKQRREAEITAPPKSNADRQMPTIPDIGRSAILQWCNEIGDIAQDIKARTMSDIYFQAQCIIDKARNIEKVLNNK